jgi:glycosyltransferase involved in cell wall biosynthesis
MKILFLITKSNWGGAQRYVFDLATALKARGETVAVAAGGTGAAGAAPGTLAHKLRDADIEHIHLTSFSRNVSLLRDLLRRTHELYRTIRDTAPDVVHLNSSKAAGLGALLARLCGVRTIVFTIHGFPFISHRPIHERILIRLATWLTLLLATDIICICTPDLQDAKRYPLITRKLHLIPNGIEPLATSPDRLVARATLVALAPSLTKLPLTTPLIATGTELTKRKGIDAVLAACALLDPHTTPYHLLVIGTGDASDALRAQAHELGIEQQVTFTGFVSDLPDHLAALDAFVLASHKEGLPYILLEVARAGVPLIASNVDGIPDIITSPDEGLLIVPGNAREIAEALRTTLTDPAAAHTRATRLAERINTHFSLERMAEATLDVYSG